MRLACLWVDQGGRVEVKLRVMEYALHHPKHITETTSYMPDKLPKGKSNNCKCLRCGKEFYMRECYIKTGAGKHCSKRCRAGTPDERFWEKVEKRAPDDCWFWKGAPNHDGYGTLTVGEKTVYAARFSYELANGPMKEGMETCHMCDVRYPPGDIRYRLCVNPSHLRAGTHVENVKETTLKGRHRTNPVRGEENAEAKLTEEIVREMRRMWHSKEKTGAWLANHFGVTRSNVSMIVNRKTWTHI